MLTILFILFLFSCSFANLSLASSVNFAENIKFQHLTAADGLSQNNVFDTIQDLDGYIWLATENGLSKYDGHKITNYKKNISDLNSIADNFIRKLFIDNKGIIWVGTANGLSKYNKNSDSFENYQHKKENKNTLTDNIIWDIYQDNTGTIWVSTEHGIHKYDVADDSFSRMNIRGLKDELSAIKTIFQDHLGNLWLGTFDNGIYIVDIDFSWAFSLRQTNKWGLDIQAKSLYDVRVIDDNYWLATNSGIFIVNKSFELQKKYEVRPENSSLSSNHIRSIAQFDGVYVLAASENGLNIINMLNESVTSVQQQDYTGALSLNYLMNIFQDNAGKFWISTYGKGLNILEPDALKFHHKQFENEFNMVDSLTEDNKGNIWFISQQSNLEMITIDGNIHKFPLGIGNVFRIKAGMDSSVWLFTTEGKLYEYNKSTKQITLNSNWEAVSDQNTNIPVEYIDGSFWFINNSGQLAEYLIKSNQLKLHNSDSNLSLIKYEAASNNLWAISIENELLKFDLQEKKFESIINKSPQGYSLSNSTTLSIDNKNIWLGSDQGVLLINKANLTSQLLNSNISLLNDEISSILIDENSNAWIVKHNSIILIDPTDSTVKSFSKSFNLIDNEFIKSAALVSSNNKIYLGSMNGFYHFEPNEISDIKQSINQPIFSALLIANKKVKIATKTTPSNTFTLNQNFNDLTDLTLKHAQSPFSIEFISPNAKFSNQIAYKYKLIGLDENWIETDQNNLRATFTNLNAGNYTFELQAFDIYNPENFKTKSLNIHILPPWWLSSGAVLIYTLISLLILAYFFQQLRHKRLYHMQIKLSEERLKLSLWGSGDEMWDWNIKKSKIYRSNIWGILEFPQDGTRNVGNGDNNETNIHQKDIARITEALQDHFDDKTEHFEATYRVKDKDDNWIWVLDRGKVVERDDKDSPTRMTGTLKDISQIKKADERLKLFAKCIQNISDAVVIYDRQFKVVDVNKSFQRITGKQKKQMLGTILTFSRYPERFTTEVKEHLLRKSGWHGEIESMRANGEVYLTDLNIDIIRDENDAISHFVGVFSDITKRKENESELRRLANSDTLTGLPNRSYFQANQARLVKKKVPHALLVFDLDNFKKVNDSMGHEVGDVLLCKVAKRIRTVGRKKDTVYRLGGDEFSILIEETNDIHTITTIAKNILTTIAQPLKLKSQEIVLYSSIGIVLYPEDGISPQELLKNADTAMYHAKHSGGNKYQFFNDSMNKKAVKRLQIENLIRHGLKDDYFSVFYQPKIEISTGKVAGMEALVRFETPGKGIISPVVFIPVSEETGQIIDIGEIVLRKACHATKAWIDAGLFDGRIAVNLSAVQFTQPNLVGMISEILKESQLPPKYLELEITEGTVMDSPQKAIDTMLQIRAMGIHLSLDDFGTGYSSLAYLKKFPLNTLKIDKAFVDDIEESEQGRNMVATIVTIAHNLGLQVVAEGVETNQQLSFLSGLRCEQLQGYLYSKPLPENDFRSYLLSHQITDNSTSFNKSN